MPPSGFTFDSRNLRLLATTGSCGPTPFLSRAAVTSEVMPAPANFGEKLPLACWLLLRKPIAFSITFCSSF
jgi:hypothetical protein